MSFPVMPAEHTSRDEFDAVPPSERPHANQLWLITFSDLMSLMLAFFVMLFAMSAIQTEAWKAVVSGLSDELAPGRETAILKTAVQARPNRLAEPKGIDLRYLEAVLAEKFRNHPVLSSARITQREFGLSIALPQELIFQSESGQMAPGAQQMLLALGQSLSSIKNRIEIHVYAAGNARNAPAGDNRYASAWELAIERSLMISRFMQQDGMRIPIIPVAHVIKRDSSGTAGEPLELVIRELGDA